MCRVAAGLTFSGAQPPAGTAEWSLLKHESHKDIDEKHLFSVLLLLRATRIQVLVFLPSGPFQELFFVRHPLNFPAELLFHCLVPPPRPPAGGVLSPSPMLDLLSAWLRHSGRVILMMTVFGIAMETHLRGAGL